MEKVPMSWTGTSIKTRASLKKIASFVEITASRRFRSGPVTGVKQA
jgi:hypothetical protein